MDSFFKLLDDLIKPGNWPFLVAFIVVLLGLAAFLAFWVIAFAKKEKLNLAYKVGPLWIHMTGGADDPSTPSRRFHKLLYVKVNCLANQKTQRTPFYRRAVNRLDPADRMVDVYDEAVYYTLKLFPDKRTLDPEEDESGGVVDPRLVIPWLDQLAFHNDEARRVKQQVIIETKEPSDTMLLVSHFLNGLQGANQDFETFADQDAESLRLVVDFSSIPNAGDWIVQNQVKLLVDGRAVDSDDLKFQKYGESVYMAHVKDAKKGSLLKMDFTFKNWDGPTAPASQSPG